MDTEQKEPQDFQPLTPREIVIQLDKYVIGQKNAKRSVAIALRNRWRRQRVAEDLRDEIAPKNIIMIGPTGVGKTEIARRLSKLAQSPFLKIEASKFTEVGYVGRDVESMVRDLTEIAINMVRAEETEKVQVKARELAEERMLDLLLPPARREPLPKEAEEESPDLPQTPPLPQLRPANHQPESSPTREKLRQRLRAGKMDDRLVEIETAQRGLPMVEIFSSAGMEEMDINLKEMFSNLLPKKTKRRKVKVPEGLKILADEEAQKLIDMDKVTGLAIERVEQGGIIFLDEIDKIAGRESTPRAGRLARGGPARPPADCGGDDRDHAVRHGEDRPHPFHRGRRVPCVQAVGSDPRTAGPLPDPGRAGRLDQGRFHPHFDGTAERPDQTVHGVAGDGRDPAFFYAGRHRRDRRDRDPREPADRKHRGPAAAHDPGKNAGRNFF